MIPVLIVPILNGPDRLVRLLDSIDVPVARVTVIDNGDVVDRLIGGRSMYPFVIHVVKPGANLGVAASWNLGIKCSSKAPYWVILNHDLVPGPGDLARLEAAVEPRANAVYYMLGMACFAVTPATIAKVGWFDENFIPAYDEDLDYSRRCDLAGVERIEAGFSGQHVGSATIYADGGSLRLLNHLTHVQNDKYYATKWGGRKQGGETFVSPFGVGEGVSAWTLDIERLRRQTWPRT